MIRAAVGVSTHADPARCALEVAGQIAQQLDGATPDWCIAFATHDEQSQLSVRHHQDPFLGTIILLLMLLASFYTFSYALSRFLKKRDNWYPKKRAGGIAVVVNRPRVFTKAWLESFGTLYFKWITAILIQFSLGVGSIYFAWTLP